jgi:hypothetical protein
MKIKVEIPERIYSKLKARARQDHRSVNDLIVKFLRATLEKEPTKPLHRITPPIIDSDRPGSLRLDNAKIYELIDFP